MQSADPAPTPLPAEGDDAGAAAETSEADEPAELSVQATAQTRVLRIGGANRYETSRMIAEHAFGTAANAFVATGVRYPDALAAGPAAALRNGPVILVSNDSGYNAQTRATLQRLGVRWVGVVGDASSVSSSIASGIQATGAQVTRYAGSDRYGTSVRLASLFSNVNTAYVVSGENFPDALAGAAVAGVQRAPMLLSQQACMPGDVRSSLIRLMPDEVMVLGGTPSVSSSSARYISCG